MTASRLDVLKALGDNTRYAIYLELARSPRPLATADIAETLSLHPNTVRPHLERMRDAGLLEIEVEQRSGVGRPQHLYSLAADAPSLGLEPPTYPLLARMLVSMAARSGLGTEEALEAGREQGRLDAALRLQEPSCLEALVAQLGVLGFDPEVAGSDDGDTAVIAFCHCPFRDLAADHPELVCGLHRGMIEGFVGALGEAVVEDFHPLPHREPCQVTVSSR
jgi:predicted ArsR family transcriptional regulator